MLDTRDNVSEFEVEPDRPSAESLIIRERIEACPSSFYTGSFPYEWWRLQHFVLNAVPAVCQCSDFVPSVVTSSGQHKAPHSGVHNGL